MASTNLTYTGANEHVTVTAEVTELTTKGSTRDVQLRLTVKVNRSGLNLTGYYTAYLAEPKIYAEDECSVSSIGTDIFKETFTVPINSDNTTADIDFRFSISIGAGSSYTVTMEGTITKLTLTKYNPGVVFIDNGTAFEEYQVYIDNGTSWDHHIPYVDNGSGWDMCN